MRTIQQMIQSEVLCCMSHMVSTLAQGYGAFERRDRVSREAVGSLDDLCEQAFELASPSADYAETHQPATVEC